MGETEKSSIAETPKRVTIIVSKTKGINHLVWGVSEGKCVAVEILTL